MQSYELVHLIQYHSERLAAGLLRQVQNSERAESYCNVSPMELQERVYEIYHDLGAWLLDKTEGDIEQRYKKIGARRTEQDVPLSELVWVIVLTKRNLWDFINDVSSPGRSAHTAEKQELLQLVEQFFDEAIHAAIVGYEGAAEENTNLVRKAS
jgi:hypothetical protein